MSYAFQTRCLRVTAILICLFWRKLIGCRRLWVTVENNIKILKVILDSRKVKLLELAAILKTSKGDAFTISYENFDLRAPVANSIPRLFTVEENH